MRFAIACMDRYSSVLNSFLEAGWEPLMLFSCPAVPPLDDTSGIIARGRSLNIDIKISPIQQRDLQELAARDCEALVVAGYGWKIPPWQEYLSYAINFHPSPLPEARGRYPLVRAILEGRKEWGVACHKISSRFDRGDILDRELFSVDEFECHESLDLRCQIAFRRLASKIAADFVPLWEKATAQAGGSYWKHWSEEDRSLDFSQPVGEIMKRVRAFGLIGTIAQVSAATLSVSHALGWTQSHTFAPGTLVYFNMNRCVVAASDGFIALIRWTPVKMA